LDPWAPNQWCLFFSPRVGVFPVSVVSAYVFVREAISDKPGYEAFDDVTSGGEKEEDYNSDGGSE